MAHVLDRLNVSELLVDIVVWSLDFLLVPTLNRNEQVLSNVLRLDEGLHLRCPSSVLQAVVGSHQLPIPFCLHLDSTEVRLAIEVKLVFFPVLPLTGVRAADDALPILVLLNAEVSRSVVR